jgi:hypothetical protein
MTKPIKRNLPIETFCNGLAELYSDESPPNKSGDNNRWRLNSEASKMCGEIIETDLVNNKPLDYLKSRSKFSNRCETVLKVDTLEGAEPQRFRKNVYDETIKYLNAYYNAIEDQNENDREPLAKKYYDELKKLNIFNK